MLHNSHYSTAQQPIKNWNVGFGRDTEYLFCGQSMFESTIYHAGIIQLNKCIAVFSKGLNKLIHFQLRYYQLTWSCGYIGIANIQQTSIIFNWIISEQA